MQRIKNITFFLYNHHFVRYILVGGTTFIIDFSILYTLHGKLKFGIAASTSVAYWTSIIYNFLLNRYWTFDAREKKSLQRHLTIYILLLIVNYLFVVVFVSFSSKIINYIIAKAIAVIVQMIWTYPIYKKVIFIPKKQNLENI